MGQKPWDGRFSEKTDHLVEQYTSSIDFDKRLFTYDIQGSIAHARTLEQAGILKEEEADAIIQGLGAVQREIEHGEMEFDDSLEDIHMHVESRLTDMLGPAAAKLHTGRSRNDQVATDVRLYLRQEVREVRKLLFGLRSVLVELAEKHQDWIMPGYTHMQRAQPVLLSHYLMAYYEMFTRDSHRFADAGERINVMPLGSGALAGAPFGLDREFTADLLDFPSISRNSMDAVSDRDFMIEFAAAASIAMMHLSRLSEEIVLWSSAEFGFLRLPDAFATGSSIMPQKKNPDVAELARGKTGRVYGGLMSLLTLMKGLPLAYNRDMQEDKETLFDCVDTLKSSLAVMAAMCRRLEYDREKMETACMTGFLNATDLADYLVQRGLPFRQAHHAVGQAVAHALDLGKELDELPLDQLQGFCKLIEDDIFDFLSLKEVASHRDTLGGTAPRRVAQAVARAKKDLAKEGT